MLNGSFSRKTWLAWVALGVGLLATVFASLQVKQGIEQDAVRQFAFTCDQVTLKIQERLGTYALILRGGNALFAASVSVDRKAWRAYVETLQVEEKVPGVQGIGFAQAIPAAELATHIATIRAEGFPEYTVRPPGERAIYTPVIYLEPFRDRNLRAFGYDMYSEPVRRAALEQARDTGEAALSGKVELVQETGVEVQTGGIMYVPVYRNGASVDTAEQRRVALIGWVYSSYRINDFMVGILRDFWMNHESKVVGLTIYDGREATPATLLFNSKPATLPDLHSLFYQQRTIDFNGHQWLLVFDHTVKLSNNTYAPAWAALTGGLTLSGLLFGLMLSVINTKANAARIADKLTEEIRRDEELLKESDALKFAILSSLPAEIAVVKCDGTILAVNELWWRFASVNGIDPFKQHATSSANGANYLALCPVDTGFITSPETWEASSGVEAVLDGSLPGFSMEYLRPTPAQQQWISMTVLPLGLGTNRSVVITHTDITERKTAEAEIAESRNLLLTVINAAPIRVFWKDRNLRYLGCNMAFAKDAGMTHPNEVIGKDDYQLGWADQAEMYRADDSAVMELGIAKLSYEEPQTTSSDQPIWIRSSKVPLRNQDNEVFGLLGIYEDITEHKKAEQELQISEERLRIITSSAQDAIIMLDEAGNIMFWNEAAERIFGYARKEVLGHNLHTMLAPLSFREAHLRAFPHFQQTGQGAAVGKTLELVGLRKDGCEFPVEVALSAVQVKGAWHSIGMVRDITGRIEAQNALTRQLELQRQVDETLRIANEEQRAIFDSATSGIALIKDSVILRCNRKLEEIFGYASGELDGTSTHLWYPDEAAYQTDGISVYKEIANGKFHRFERQLIRKDGSLFWARLSGQALDSKDPTLAIVEIIDNITSEREAADLLLKAKEMAEDASRIKSEFLANMSHEIRTPINGVLGMLDLLRETEMTSTQLDWIETAHGSGEVLLGIINDILDLSKLEAGKVEVEQVDFNLIDLVEDICASMAGQAHAKGLELSCLLPKPLRWRGDPLRIRQILTNLIGNALKFTERGDVSVSVTQSPLTDSQDELRFEVHDTGIGILPAAQLRLFKPFSQADSTTSRSFGGSGLGLFISKKLVELMGGTIGVNSVLGRGSCFWFTLPLVQSEGIETSEPSCDLAGKRVLIVDDNATNRNILGNYLSRWGLEVSEVDNGNAALMKLQNSALDGLVYDLIVLDMQMPVMDGLTLAKCLTQIPNLAKIPIILLSSGDQLDLADYQSSGIVQRLLKPVRQLQFFDAMVNALQGVTKATIKPARTEIQWPSYNGKKVLVVEDNKINQKVIVAKLAIFDIVPDLAENGQLALDKLAQCSYDLILMDCQMPVMDGYIATRELRLLEASQGLPHQTVIALTANALEGEREKCLAAGMDDYLSKPIDSKQLMAILACRLGSQPTEIVPTVPNDNSSPVKSNLSVWDATAALENLDGDSDLLDEMIALFLMEGPKQLSELSRFQAEGNLPALANTAHVIKGAAGHFYGVTVKECASLLEQTARSGQSADYQGMTDALINAVTDLINNLRLAKNSTNPGK